MSDPYIGEIRIFAGNFAPAGWAFCNGQSLPISENDALFTLIGTTYGGDGETTFNLPDLQGRLPLHQGANSSGSTYILGETGGAESVTLTTQQIPSHSHALTGSSTNATTTGPTNTVPGTLPEATTLSYGTDAPATTLNQQSVTPVGGSQPHENTQPFLCVSFIISLFGIFPNPS